MRAQLRQLKALAITLLPRRHHRATLRDVSFSFPVAITSIRLLDMSHPTGKQRKRLRLVAFGMRAK